jgi:GNAT superfamily N-acetyltransferase
MNDGQKLILQEAKWSDYLRFRSLCCVDTLPRSAGQCWTGAVVAADESTFINADAAFIGYNWPFRNNGIRQAVFSQIHGCSRRYRMAYFNKNLRTLSRVMVRPDCRRQGIATQMVLRTVEQIGVPFIECLTFTASIAKILERCGFRNLGRTGGLCCDYYLLSK